MIKHSVIITCYKSPQYVKPAINSVLSQIDNNDELIVVDDYSDQDNILRNILLSISDSRIKIILRNQNGGISLARNDGLKLALGQYISFLDHDDVWYKNRHQEVENIINKNPNIDIISGCVEHFYSPEIDINNLNKYKLPDTQSAILAGTVTIKKSLLDKAGYFNPEYKVGEFFDLISRLRLFNPAWIKSDKIFLSRRIHNNNFTHYSTDNGKAYMAAIRAHLHRKDLLEQ